MPRTAALLSLSLLGCAVAAPPATTPASVPAPTIAPTIAPTVAPTVAPPAPVASEPAAPEPAVCSYTAEPRTLAPELVVPDDRGACRSTAAAIARTRRSTRSCSRAAADTAAR